MPAASRFAFPFRPAPARRAVSAVVAAAMLVASPAGTPPPARAEEGPSLPIIRDAEIEQLLRDYSAPILRAAGLSNQNIHIVIINDPAFNAFVMDGRRIFINTGALLQCETPNEVIGVLAHETGHIVGGHLAKMRQQLAQAQTAMILATILGIGAAVAGSRSNTGVSQAGMAAIGAPQAALERTLIAYQRQQEESADRARRRPLCDVAPDAGRARQRTGGVRAIEPALGQEGRRGVAAAS
jgi:predicted Zn-dependent protease